MRADSTTKQTGSTLGKKRVGGGVSCRAVFSAGLVLFLTAQVFAQRPSPLQSYPEADVKAGSTLFSSNCVFCHGDTGDKVPGVSLLKGEFLHPALNDEGIIHTIMNGSESKLMPPLNLSREEAQKVVAFLRTEALGGAMTLPSGDAAHGKALMESNNCLSCHRVDEQGSFAGPELTNVMRRGRTTKELQDAILNPDKEVFPDDRVVSFVTKDGKTLNARLLNQDTYSIQIMEPGGHLASYQRADIRNLHLVQKGLMPSYSGKLSNQDVNDILNYLATKGK
jgi:putative heme-binding domain-containing protein